MGTLEESCGVEIAARSAPSFPYGVRFVDLAAITDHSLIPLTVASATGLQPSAPGGLVEALAAFLNGRSGLLVLDNCEHLMPTVSDVVSTIAGGGGEVTVLATSREPLGLTGERLVTVDPLDVGDAGAVGATAPAVELFLQRARDVAADRLTALAPGAVLELARRICAAVDGLPLAIELAAARLQAYSLVEIEEQVRTDPSRLSRPTGRTGDRGSSLRAALDASERLLTDAERRLHRELTVLPGPFTVDAALGVSGTAGPADASADGGDAADVLPLLVGRSLLAVVSPSRPDGPSRFRQLATVRAHAARGLDTRAAAHHRRPRQDWVLNLVGRGPRLGSFAQADWFTALDDDLTTVRAVLEDCFLPTESPAPGSGSSADAIGVVLRNGLVDYCYFRSQTAEAAERLERAVRAVLAGAVVDVADETLALEPAASIRCLQGRGDRAAPLVDRLLDAAAGVSAARRAEVGHALGRLATAVWSTDDFATMRRVHTAMTAIADGVDDPALKVFADAVDCLIALPATGPAHSSHRAGDICAAAVDSDHAYAAWSAAGACAVAAIQERQRRRGTRVDGPDHRHPSSPRRAPWRSVPRDPRRSDQPGR